MKNRLLAAVLVSILFTACGNSDTDIIVGASINTEQNATISETKAISTETEHVCGETTVITTISTLITTADETIADTTIQIEPDPYDWSDFVLNEYCGEYDEVMPLKYRSWLCTDDAENISEYFDVAYQAVTASEYYKEVIAFGKENLEWNGTEFFIGEEHHFLLNDFPDYIDYNSAPELVLKPKLKSCIQHAFDGVNTEEILIFSFPLAESQIEWSGTSLMYIVVYVNAKGEAGVLYNVSAQTLGSVTAIEFSDGVTHLDFGRGHTSGTSKSTILSFSNGEAKVEYNGMSIRCDDEGILMRNDISGYFKHNILFFRDGIRNCYCELKAVQLPDEISKVLLADKSIRTELNIKEENYSDVVYAIGGKYILVCGEAFEFDNGIFIPYGSIIPSFEEDAVPALNVNLNAEDFS